MYKAIVKFADLKDNKHLYHPGDTFPRDGLTVSPERLAELSGHNNAARQPVIAEIALKTPRKGRRK